MRTSAALAALVVGAMLCACGGAPTTALTSPTAAVRTPAPTLTPSSAPSAAATASPSSSPSESLRPASSAAPTAIVTTTPTPTPAAAINGLRVTFPSGDLTLTGMVWKPVGNGPFKAVLWNHGSEKAPGLDGSNPLLGPVFAGAGYVFFMPMRRGQGFSEGTWIVDATAAVPPAERPALIARLHTTEQLADQLAGLAYLRNLPYVDTTQVAVAGWSYGGIQTVLGAGDASAGYVAAVAFTPASQSWVGNPDLQEAMTSAATPATIPFLFVQADNDYRLVPTQELTDAIVDGGGTATRSIYPAFGTINQDGHEFAVRGSDIWGAEVLAFLAAAFDE